MIQVQRAYTVHNNQYYYNIFGAELNSDFKLYPKDIYPTQSIRMAAINRKLEVVLFDTKNPIQLVKGGS